MSEHFKILLDSSFGPARVVRRFRSREAMDAPYSLLVDIFVPGPPPALEDVVGTDASVELIYKTTTRRIGGLVLCAEVIEELSETVGTSLRLELVPALHLLGLRRNTRVFQEMSAPEILEAVLGDGLSPYGREAGQELEAEYATREYCVQYQETDLAFVHRLMQEEGIAYSFEHDGDVETLLLRDNNDSYARAEGCDVPVVFEPDARSPFSVYELGLERRLTTTKIVARDWDFTTGGFLVEDEAGDADERGRVRESYEHGWGRSVSLWDYGAERYESRDTAHRVGVRLEEALAGGKVLRGSARRVELRPGTTFELRGHPTVGFDNEYLITKVEHDAVFGGATGAVPARDRESASDTPRTRLWCIPLEVPHRPLRTARKPAIEGIQTAIVTGPSGEEIHTDEHGRIKVEFHWDRDKTGDETSSCWLRVQQKWAGEGWGFWWLPRIGMEVVVQFIDGDPDRPLAVGSVYNANNPPPYALPDEKTKSTIKSNSSPGGDGFNELRFEDKLGEEQIFTHAQKDYNEVVENDHTTRVHNDQLNEVDGDQEQIVHNNQTERVDIDQEMSVGGDRTVHVEGDFEDKVDGTETRTVTGAVTESFGADESRSIGGDVSETIGASEAHDVGVSQTENIGGARTQTIGAASSLTISGSLLENVAGGITMNIGGPWSVSATGGYTMIAPGGFKVDAPGGLQVGAPAGVSQVDSVRDIIASIIGSKGVVQRGVAGVKRAFNAIQIVGVGNDVGMDGALYRAGLHIQTKASVLEKVGAKLMPSGIHVKAGPSSDS